MSIKFSQVICKETKNVLQQQSGGPDHRPIPAATSVIVLHKVVVVSPFKAELISVTVVQVDIAH